MKILGGFLNNPQIPIPRDLGKIVDCFFTLNLGSFDYCNYEGNHYMLVNFYENTKTTSTVT